MHKLDNSGHKSLYVIAGKVDFHFDLPLSI